MSKYVINWNPMKAIMLKFKILRPLLYIYICWIPFLYSVGYKKVKSIIAVYYDTISW